MPAPETAPPHVVLLVGGSGGIGAALAGRLRERNATVILAGRDASRLNEVADRLGAERAVLDARDGAAVEAEVRSSVERHGRLDAAVNCAGSILLKPAHLLTDEEFADTLALNLVTAFNVVRAAARAMMRQEGGGSIALCSSAAAQRGLPNHEAIAAAKAGVEGLVRAAAASYARARVRVNCVAPGLIRTGLSRAIVQNEVTLKASASLHALGRIGEPEEVASALDWLIHPGQTWVTGQVLGVDGGLAHIQARPGA